MGHALRNLETLSSEYEKFRIEFIILVECDFKIRDSEYPNKSTTFNSHVHSCELVSGSPENGACSAQVNLCLGGFECCI